MDWRSEALEQLDFYWEHWRPRLDGLTDAEYFWEPVADCWSLRPAGGGFRMDFAFETPEPPPFTTIAWRLAHIAGHVFHLRANSHFGDGSYRMDNEDHPGTAAAALAYLDEQHHAWRDGLGAMDAEAWARPVGPAEGPYAERSYLTLVLHLNRELCHHGGEVALLRDLYAHQQPGR
ncbi:hypothetical protein CFN78_14150 [Amycolatopsis antarctica]|uniref:DinB-like domain-containing protein n=1 Tax=Amycolatopsis antarctica TaxID=1854586 RepID=A0A263D2Z9_9PSEU|nr:hypothetical protein CFN78_14150 [Amycolatopsis antarctica]